MDLFCSHFNYAKPFLRISQLRLNISSSEWQKTIPSVLVTEARGSSGDRKKALQTESRWRSQDSVR